MDLEKIARERETATWKIENAKAEIAKAASGLARDLEAYAARFAAHAANGTQPDIDIRFLLATAGQRLETVVTETAEIREAQRLIGILDRISA